MTESWQLTEEEWQIEKERLAYNFMQIVEAMHLASKKKYTMVQILRFINQKSITNIDKFIQSDKL